MTVEIEIREEKVRASTGAVVREPELVDAEQQMLSFVFSDETVDRQGDIISVKGWDLKNFKRNPVFQFAHDYNQPPVGQVTAISKDTVDSKASGKGGPALRGTVMFTPEQTNPFGAMVFRLMKPPNPFMRATSVGFRPLKTTSPQGDDERDQMGLGRFGVLFEKAELLEVSAVPVPANPNALQEAVQRGVINARGAQYIENAYGKLWAAILARGEERSKTAATQAEGTVVVDINPVSAASFQKYVERNREEIKAAIEEAIDAEKNSSLRGLLEKGLKELNQKVDRLSQRFEQLALLDEGADTDTDEDSNLVPPAKSDPSASLYAALFEGVRNLGSKHVQENQK